MERPLATYQMRLTNLPRGERVMYRGLRLLGFSRHDANLIIFGRWTERLHIDNTEVSLWPKP